MTEQVPHSVHLDQIITCVKQLSPREHSGSKLQNLYGEAGELIKNFQTNINRCKRYNQAKINRKYQMIIQDLETEVRKLNQKLKIEQDARSPTKKHVADILDQLVSYKQQNERLKKQLLECKVQLNEAEDKGELQAAAIKKLQNTQPKTMVERLPSLNSGINVCDSIKEYLKDKQNVRKIVSGTERSNLQKFLHHNVAKSWNWTVGNLLQQLDKWAQGIKPTKQVDMWRIRSSVAKTFSDYLDDSKQLTRPASYTKGMLSPMSNSSRQSLNKKQSRFSILGERREKSSILNISPS